MKTVAARDKLKGQQSSTSRHHLEPRVHWAVLGSKLAKPHASNVFNLKDMHYFAGRKMIAEVAHKFSQDVTVDRVNSGVGVYSIGTYI
jgi:hypothetical protein